MRRQLQGLALETAHVVQGFPNDPCPLQTGTGCPPRGPHRLPTPCCGGSRTSAQLAPGMLYRSRNSLPGHPALSK